MNHNISNFAQTAIELTLPCKDNGDNFVISDRIDKISSILEQSQYKILGKNNLSYVYRHNEYKPERSTILISNHVDSLYKKYFTRISEDKIYGTFDNSACNGVVVELMKQGVLPPQALIAFTGDEEEDSIGVDQTIEILKEKMIFNNLELVISLDLTEESFKKRCFTVENFFVRSHNEQSSLKFSKKREIRGFLESILGTDVKFINDAEPDESWQYDEHNLNCFTLCLPCLPVRGDMHDDRGVAVKIESFERYAKALQEIVVATAKRLANTKNCAECI